VHPAAGLGVKAGVNASNMYTNDTWRYSKYENRHSRRGFFGRIAIADNLAFQPEFIYTMKGAGAASIEAGLSRAMLRSLLTTLEIPLLLVLRLNDNLSIHGGGYVAFLSKVKITNESNIDFFDFEREMNEDDFESIDYGLVIGGSADFDNFSIGARYDYGLKTVGKDKFFAGTSKLFPDARNSAWQLYFALNLF